MQSRNILGLIFCNSGDEMLPELTSVRAIGSVPFGCRYRLVDFSLSSMVNAGISKVGLITKRNYQSLADHVGNGRPWDLARKNGGLSILSPYVFGGTGLYTGRIDALSGCMQYLEKSREEYVVLTNANIIANVDFDAMIDQHLALNADVTIAYKKGLQGSKYLKMDGDKILEIASKEEAGTDNCYIDLFLIRRELLISMIKEAAVHNYTNLTEDVLKRQVKSYNYYGFGIDGYVRIIDGMQSYFDGNMDLLHKSVRDQLFKMDAPIYTKLRDDMPSRYGFDSGVADSVIADGCVIEGEVHNSIIFRGVTVEKGAKLENCIIMQSGVIHANAQLSYVVADKNVSIKEGRTLMGCKTFPMVIGKGLTV